jgi:hypothetical protein
METYRFYSLPYCKTHAVSENEVAEDPDNFEEEDDPYADTPRGDHPVRGDREGAERFKQRLGETIAGDQRETSPYEITFMDEVRNIVSHTSFQIFHFLCDPHSQNILW